MEADPRVRRVDSILSADLHVTLEEFQFLYSLSSPETIRGPQVALALDELVRDDRSLSMIRVSPDHGPVSGEAHDLARDIRASPPSGGLDTKVTGVTSDFEDTVALMYSNFPKMIIYVSVVTYLALFFLFRSVVPPLKAVALNILSILASLERWFSYFNKAIFKACWASRPRASPRRRSRYCCSPSCLVSAWTTRFSFSVKSKNSTKPQETTPMQWRWAWRSRAR